MNWNKKVENLLLEDKQLSDVGKVLVWKKCEII